MRDFLFADVGTGAFRFFKPDSGPGETTSIGLPLNVPDGGLFAWKNSLNQTEVLYLAGGIADINGVTGNSVEFNKLFYGVFNLNGATVSSISPLTEIANVDVYENGDGQAGPVLAGLTMLGDNLYSVQRRFNGALSNQPDDSSYLTRLLPNTLKGTRGPGSLEVDRLMEFPTGDLQTVAGAPNRGTLFAVGFVSPEFETSAAYPNLTVLEVDPRTSSGPYITDTFWGAAGDFNTGDNTVTRASFNPMIHGSAAKIGGASFSPAGGLIINGFGSVSTSDGRGQNAFFLTVNPNIVTAGTGNSHLVFKDGGGNLSTIGFSAANQVSGPLPPPPVLSDPGPSGLDFSIGGLFGRVSYSGESLRSGVIQQVFSQRFIETAQDPIFCAIDPVIGQIPSALSRNADKTQGIARATFDLRNPLSGSHPCQVPSD